jgi:hypothetical protein
LLVSLGLTAAERTAAAAALSIAAFKGSIPRQKAHHVADTQLRLNEQLAMIRAALGAAWRARLAYVGRLHGMAPFGDPCAIQEVERPRRT